VANFRVIVSEVVFGVNFLAISLETLRCAQQLTNLFMFLYQKGVRSQKYSHQVTLSAVHWQVAPLHQPLSPTTSSVVPGVSSSPRTLFSERHFWGAVRTLTLATVQQVFFSRRPSHLSPVGGWVETAGRPGIQDEMAFAPGGRLSTNSNRTLCHGCSCAWARP
jgi:hypothetical protein